MKLIASWIAKIMAVVHVMKDIHKFTEILRCGKPHRYRMLKKRW